MQTQNRILKYSLELLSELIRNRQSFLKTEDLSHYSNLRACKELCTIKLSLPRRLGNTTLCLNIASLFKNVAVITYSKYHTEEFKRDIKELRNSEFNHKLITDKNNIEALCGISDQIDIVAIDISSFISKKKIEYIYKKFGKNKIYILLG